MEKLYSLGLNILQYHLSTSSISTDDVTMLAIVRLNVDF